jgi:phytoene synthase
VSDQLSHAYAVCRGIARRAAKNFYYGFMVLPSEKRNALSAVYAFMRHADDISDEPGVDPQLKRQKLSEWLEAAKAVFGGKATDDPVLMALGDAQAKFKIPPELFEKLVYGTSLDLDIPPASAESPAILCNTFEDLKQYCYYVASVVGLVCIRIFGYQDTKAEFLAEDCGLAFQLTNIIRDIKEDAGMGRIYIPADDMVSFKVAVDDFLKPSIPERLQWLLAAEGDRAREYYASARDLIKLIDEDSRPALWVLVSIYARLLEKIAERKYDVFGKKIGLSVREKVFILGKGLLKRLA